MTERILNAHGITLAPIAVRLAEIKAAHRAAQEAKVLSNRYRREITKFRKAVRMTIHAGVEYQLEGPWQAFLESLSVITDGMLTADMDLAELQDVHASLVALKERVDNAFLRASNQQNKNPKEVQTEPHHTNYNRAHSCESNGSRRGASAPQHQDLRAFGAIGSPKKPESGFAGSQAFSRSRPAPSEGARSRSDSEFSLSLVMTACPRMKGFAPGISGWADLVEAADLACLNLGINKSAWIEAREAMGEIAAATAVALILEKHMAQGVISEP
jgi:replication initiation protein RepC